MITGWIHHYFFTDGMMIDSRTAYLRSELTYQEKQHGPLINHWCNPVYGDHLPDCKKARDYIWHVTFEDGHHETWNDCIPHGDYLLDLRDIHGKITLQWPEMVKDKT